MRILFIFLGLVFGNLSFADYHFSLPIQHWQQNGARVYHIQNNHIPMVQLRVIVDAGSLRDGQKPGLALFTNQVLPEGYLGLTGHNFTEQLEKLGAQLETEVTRELAVIGIKTLSKPDVLTATINLLSQMLSRPVFLEEGVERARRHQLAVIARQQESPEHVVNNAFYDTYFSGQPYSQPVSGNQTSIESIQVDEVRDFYDQYYVTRNMSIVIVGAVDEQQVRQLMGRLLANIPLGKTAPAMTPTFPETHSLKHVKFSSMQTHVQIGLAGVDRNDADYHALYLGNYILGGNGLSSRLMQVVRDQHGLTYGIGSAMLPFKTQGLMVVNLQTRNQEAERALSLTLEEMQRFIQQGPTNKELKAAKKGMLGRFVRHSANNAGMIELLTLISFYELPLDYLQQFLAKIENLTVKDIRTALQRRINLDRKAILTVGPDAEIHAAS